MAQYAKSAHLAQGARLTGTAVPGEDRDSEQLPPQGPPPRAPSSRGGRVTLRGPLEQLSIRADQLPCPRGPAPATAWVVRLAGTPHPQPALIASSVHPIPAQKADSAVEKPDVRAGPLAGPSFAHAQPRSPDQQAPDRPRAVQLAQPPRGGRRGPCLDAYTMYGSQLAPCLRYRRRALARAAVSSRARAACHTIAILTKQMSRMYPIPKSRPNACPIWTPYRNATSGMLLGCTARREPHAGGKYRMLYSESASGAPCRRCSGEQSTQGSGVTQTAACPSRSAGHALRSRDHVRTGSLLTQP